MVKEYDWPSQREVDEALRQYQRAWPKPNPASELQEAKEIALAEAPSWFEGKPARRLLAYLQPMEQAKRLAPLDAMCELLLDLAEEDDSSLLVLHPVRPLERLSAYALRNSHAHGGGLEGPGVALEWDGPPQRLFVTPGAGNGGGLRINLSDSTAEDAEQSAFAWLLDYWLENLMAGRINGLDRPPGLPPGAVLGVLEVDAARLWPALFGTVVGPVPAPAQASRACALQIDRLRGEDWTAPQRFALLQHFDARKLSDPRLKAEALHEEMAAACFVGASTIKAQLVKARNERKQSRQGHLTRRTA